MPVCIAHTDRQRILLIDTFNIKLFTNTTVTNMIPPNKCSKCKAINIMTKEPLTKPPALPLAGEKVNTSIGHVVES